MTFRSYTFALALLFGAGNTLAQTAVQIEVFKSPYCGCCEQWIEHLRGNGFEVQTHKVAEPPADIQKLHIPENLESCHTAKVDGYVIIGHVPVADIRRLLKEKPKAVGLSVPGMPAGSPGMESAKPVPYDTLLVKADGTTQVFARH